MAALIAARRADGIPVVVACRALGVSRSWLYKHKNGQLPPRAQRRERLKAEVVRLFGVHGGKYGSPRITADLREAGWRVSENTVAALMREQHLAGLIAHLLQSAVDARSLQNAADATSESHAARYSAERPIRQ